MSYTTNTGKLRDLSIYRGQSFPNGIFHQFRKTVEVQFVHHLFAVHFDSLHTDMQGIGHLAGGPAFGAVVAALPVPGESRA